jgi:hypothetical protein
MDEFTSIAIWLLIIYLSINTCIIWFSTSTTFSDNGLGISGLTADNSYGQADLNSTKLSFFGTDCSSASPTDLAFAPCFLLQTTSMFSKIINSLWTFLTAWVNLLTVIFSPIPGGNLFLGLLIPFFGLIEATAIFVILMRLAGIIRGGS